jgi:hypothetical protein
MAVADRPRHRGRLLAKPTRRLVVALVLRYRTELTQGVREPWTIADLFGERHGTHRRDHPATFSRVIEVDPRTNALVWEYTDQSLFEFFSPYISSAQRLANGNTLICEGCHGRIFEVTHEGEVVWEYVSPYFVNEQFYMRGFRDPAELGPTGLNNWVFRAIRYTAEEIEVARSA